MSWLHNWQERTAAERWGSKCCNSCSWCQVILTKSSKVFSVSGSPRQSNREELSIPSGGIRVSWEGVEIWGPSHLAPPNSNLDTDKMQQKKFSVRSRVLENLVTSPNMFAPQKALYMSNMSKRRYQGGAVAIHSWHRCGLLNKGRAPPKRARFEVTMRTICDTKSNSTSYQFRIFACNSLCRRWHILVYPGFFNIFNALDCRNYIS